MLSSLTHRAFRWNPRSQRSRLPLRFEQLEDRSTPATFTVLNTNDSGADSFRQAILDANSTVGADVIEFAIGKGGVATIQPLSALPVITDRVTIDGFSQDTTLTTPPVVLDGSQAGFGGGGLQLQDHTTSIIQGLVINGFSGAGIDIGNNSGGHTIRGNFIGTNAAGTAALPNGNTGIRFSFGAIGNTTIGGPVAADRNVISGNTGNGVSIEATVTNITIEGNFIGVDVTGGVGLANTNNGINASVFNEAISGIVIRGNTLSGNFFNGIQLNANSSGNPADITGVVIVGNTIGTSSDGSKAIANGGTGVSLSGITASVIGGATPADRNIISGNAQAGITVDNFSFNTNFAGPTIEGNFIGIAADGVTKLGNGSTGVSISNSSGTMTDVVVKGNVISGNNGAGVILNVNTFGATADILSAKIQSNKIGTDAEGKIAVGNTFSGIQITQASSVLIGGPDPADRNILSGNGSRGVEFSTSFNFAGTVVGPTLQGNFIGTDVTGAIALPNASGGVSIASSSGTITGVSIDTNVISGNKSSGVSLFTSTFGGSTADFTGTKIFGNKIGTSADGLDPLGNDSTGITVNNLSDLLIGGLTKAEANIIAANNNGGINLSDVKTFTIQGNIIGTDATQTTLLPNGAFTQVTVSAFNTAVTGTIGGTAAGAGNVIAAPNNQNGVTISSNSVDNPALVTILGNRISPVSPNGIGFSAFGGVVNEGITPPQLSPVVETGTGVTLSGSFAGQVDETYRVEFFSDQSRSTFLGFQSVTTDGNGLGKFSIESAGTFANGTRFATTITRDKTGASSVYSNIVNIPGGGIVTGIVFQDQNGDGKQDTNESGLSNLTVFADINANGKRDSDEPFVNPSFNGQYSLTIPLDGSYLVRVEAQPGFVQTTPNPAAIDLAEGKPFAGPDFGFKRFGGSISGNVFEDYNGDGKQDTDEPVSFFADLQVFVDLNTNGKFDDGEPNSTSSFFNFTLPDDGNYTVLATNGADFVQTTTNPAPVALSGGTSVNDLDFGFKLATGGYVRGSVFYDTNGNGKQDVGELNFGPSDFSTSVYVDLNSDGIRDFNEPSDFVDLGNGTFFIRNTVDGTFPVRLDLSAFSEFKSQQTSTNPADAKLVGGLLVDNVSFGYKFTVGGIITGKIFTDLNQNGTLEPGEPGASSRQVYVDENANGKFDSGEANTFTELSGEYRLQVSTDGDHLVRLIPQTNTLQTTTDPVAVAVEKGNFATGPDIGFKRVGGSISVSIFEDVDGNGKQDDGFGTNIPDLFTFVDLNNNGKFDAGEPNSTSPFPFFSLPDDGTYQILATAVDFQQTTANVNPVTLIGGATRSAGSIGFQPTKGGYVEGTVFFDADGNGLQDAGDLTNSFSTIGLRVYLDVNGNGKFDSDEPNGFPSGTTGAFIFKSPVDGTFPLRLEITGTSFQTKQTTTNPSDIALANGKTLSGFSFGYNFTAGGILSGVVFIDQNANGVFDTDENHGFGTIFADANGNDKLDAGEVNTNTGTGGIYQLAVPTDGPVTLRFVSTTTSPQTTPNPAPINIAGGISITGADFGYKRLGGTVSGTLFFDLNGDGKQDPSENGAINGTRVFLDLNGNGKFDDGEPNSTSSFFFLTAPTDGTFSLMLEPGTGFKSSTPNPLDVLLAEGIGASGIQFGVQPLAGGLITGSVFYDVNTDGKRDPGDVNVAPSDSSVRVYLDLDNDNVFDFSEPNVTISSNGTYSLYQPIDGTFFVRIVGNQSFNSRYGFNQTTVNPADVVLAAGNTVSGVDFGFNMPAGGLVTGMLFDDANGNGKQDTGEVGLNNSQLAIFVDEDGNQTAQQFGNPPEAVTTQTSADGTFALLIPTEGKHQVLVGANPNFFSQELQFNVTSTNPIEVTLNLGSSQTGLNYGVQLFTIIRGTVFNDANRNGTFDFNEVAVADVTVFADLNNNGAFDTGEPNAKSDVNGLYLLDVGTGGDYFVRAVPPTGQIITNPVTKATTAKTDLVTFGPGVGLAVAAGGTLTGKVFVDQNQNGQFDTGEPAGVGFVIFADANGNDKLDTGEASTISQDDGSYKLFVLTDGKVAARLQAKADFTQTTTNPGLVTLVGANTVVGGDFGVADALVHIGATNKSLVEGDTGTSKIVFTVVRSGNTAPEVTVNFKTADGSAIAGKDYVAQTGSVTFAAGQTTADIIITINGNTLLQADRSFDLLLTATGVDLQAPTIAGTILDDDTPATITPVVGTTPQAAQVSTKYPALFAIEARNKAGALVEGATIQFEAPTTGPSGTFAGATQITTNANGVATASAFTANATAGEFVVTATGVGFLVTAAKFELSNTLQPPPNTPPSISDIPNQTMVLNTTLGPIAFQVGDVQTAAANLVVTAKSSNTTLIPNTGLALGGAGTNRTLSITSATNQTGTATITVTVTDGGGLTATDTFTVTVTGSVPPPNTPPTITDIPNQSTLVGTSKIGPLGFTIGDAQTPAADLKLSGDSSNPGLIPNSAITFSGTGAGRSVTVAPVAGVTGSTVITITVTDGGGLTTQDKFTVTVNPTTPPSNTPPTITDIPNQIVTIGSSKVGPLGFTIGDAQTPVADLKLTGTSSNPNLIPNSAITFGGTGANRTITVAPVVGISGSTTITVAVIDGGGLSVTDSFTVTVNAELPQENLIGVSTIAVGSEINSTVRVYGPDGAELFAFTPFPGASGGVRTASADFNGDGVPDVVAGTGPGGATAVQVVDGKTQQVLFSINPFEAGFKGGVYVAAGDVTGDGNPELIITPDEGGGPRVRIFDGTTFREVADFFGIDDPNFRGGARAAFGDVNGDGVADLVVSAGFLGGPRIAVFDGKSLAFGKTPQRIVQDFFAFEETLRNGAFVAVGDVNGDGKADLLFGGGPGGGPRVRIADAQKLLDGGAFGTLDNLPGAEIANFFAGDPNNREGVRLAVKNLDDDNRADLVTGVRTTDGSRVIGYSGISLTSGNPVPDLELDAFPEDAAGIFVG